MFTLRSTVYQSPRSCRNLCLRSPCLLSTSAWGNGEFRFWTNTATHFQMSTPTTLFLRAKITESPQLHNIRKTSILRSSGNLNLIIMHIYPVKMHDNKAYTILILLWQVAAIHFLDILTIIIVVPVCYLMLTVHSWQHKPTFVPFTQKTFIP